MDADSGASCIRGYRMKTIVQLVKEQKEYFLEKDTAAKQAVEANIAPVEADASSASRAYVVGEQLFLNDVLYDVTSPISVGDAIVVGTNITAANKLSADIKSKIDDLYSKNQTLTNQIEDAYEVMGQNGAKNVFNPNDKVSNDYVTITDTNGDGSSLRIYTPSAKNWQSGTFIVNVKPNTDYRVTGQVAYTSGVGRVIVSTTGGTTIAVSEDFTQNTDISFTFNSGNNTQVQFALGVTKGTVEVGDITYNYVMIKDARDTDPTYQLYAETNQQLTKDTTALLDNLEVNGAVNMFDNILTSQVINGITYTVNDDGSVTCNGTATANGGVMLGGIAVKSGKAYKISGCPSGGDSDNSYALIVRTTNSTSASVIGSDIGNGFIYTPTSDTTVYLQIRFASGQTTNNLTFKPMITVSSYNGDYVPYAKTNKELTDELAIDSTSVTNNGVTATFSKWGKVATIFLTGAFTEGVATDGLVLTIPSGFRPKNTVVSMKTTNELASSSKEALLYLANSGNLTIAYPGSAAGDGIRGAFTYITD